MPRTTAGMRTLLILLAAVLIACPCRADVAIDLQSAVIRLDGRGCVTALEPAGAAAWTAVGPPAFLLDTDAGTLAPQSVERTGERLRVNFEGGARAEFQVTEKPGCAVLELLGMEGASSVRRFRLFALPAPPGGEYVDTINAARHGGWMAAVLGAEVNVAQHSGQFGAARADRAGCSHRFLPEREAKVGRQAARFTATCNDQPGGWAMQGKATRRLDLTGCRALRLWVHGDGQGQALKVQLFDGMGGYRDDYLTIDFTGWRQVTLDRPALDTLRYDRVAAVNFYYNGMPAGKTVSCGIDHVEAILGAGDEERAVLLEDFEDAASPLWASDVRTLDVETVADHGITPARFAVMACPEEEFFTRLPEVQAAAGLPSPRPGGAWNKRSPWVERSYLFLTSFGEADFDAGLALARRGGFDMILLGQESWCESTGHYEINRQHFPDGLPGLVRTVERFKQAGFKVGLHFLAASIYPPDKYLTPVPDPRLVTGAETALAAPIDAAADFIPASGAPADFPDEDGGYMGKGTVLRIGDELIAYGERSLEAPFGFRGCRRGHLGTKAASHAAGEKVVHLIRSYGYHMVDLDSSLFDEVTTNFARVANACEVDMLYFDGAELLQGDHSYYNGRLIGGYYNKLARKDILVQASSFSPYSWHIVARSASADGHGDLKGYLDERSPWLDSFLRRGMPLDIGWYYGYDPSCTPDMYEYVLGATIGYGASVSFQVSPAAAARHPFTGDILDLIARYEKLRLSGRVPAEMRERLRIDPALGGDQTPEQRAGKLHLRREYRLIGAEGREAFQRVVYTPWHDVLPAEEASKAWTVEVPAGSALVGFQVHAQPGPWLAPGPSYDAPDAVALETFDDLAPYTGGRSETVVRQIAPGQAGSVLPGVSHAFALADEPGPAGQSCAVYSAESTLNDASGWSAIGKVFDPPLDISAHRAIGFWLRGDGGGGLFKLQLRDDRGAMDYYVPNDFTGWRYQQLARPEKDPIDYSRLRHLMFYYNGLPARTKVSCGIDDVRALARLDVPTLSNPAVEIGGRRLAWNGTLSAGQYAVLWPGEVPRQYGGSGAEAVADGDPIACASLPPGNHPVQFSCGDGVSVSLRVRLTLQPPERHALP